MILQYAVLGIKGIALGAVISVALLIPWGQKSSDKSVPVPAPDSPAGLIAKYHCWSNNQPAGVKIAGHAVVTKDGSDHPIYIDSGEALAQFFGGNDYGLTIHGFCR